MESFLTSYTSISDITIFTTLCKRIETGEWTGDKEKELRNFKETLDRVINHLENVKDSKRLEQLNKFREGGLLKQRLSKKFKLSTNTILKGICKDFITKEQEKHNKPSQKCGDAVFGEFLDKPERLQKLTTQMLVVLSRVWSSPKWKANTASLASTERKGSNQQARRSDYLIVANVNSIEVEIGYLET
ncbi:3666_t:CDS:2, partial [Racocetra fulgida]